MAKKSKLKERKSKEKVERPLVRKRKYKQFFLIVCEDEATEPAYFQQFQAIFDEFAKETLYLKTVGTGRSPKGVVTQAIVERANLKQDALKEVDFVWVVFDKDDADLNETTLENFEAAFLLAEKENIQVAYSNEVFELWLLLHLTTVNAQSPIPRKEIYAQLEAAIQKTGEKYGCFVYQHGSPEIIKIIKQVGNEAAAIQKAENLLKAQAHQKPVYANPSTKVHLLVKELRSWIAFYQQA